MNVFTIIGMIVVGLLALALLLALSLLLLAAWKRGLRRASDHFYDESNVRRMRIAAILSALQCLKPHKIPAVWQEAAELVEESDE